MSAIIAFILDVIFYKFPISRRGMIDIVNSYLHNNKPALKAFLSNHADFIIEEMENVPSTLRNGRHIKKVIDLVSFFNLQENNSIIDIGSAFGNIAIRFATAFPKSNIYCFEPIKGVFDKLLENTKPYSNITPFNLALGNPLNEIEKATIHITNNLYSSSILRINSNIDSNAYLSSAIKEIKNENVKLISLDYVLRQNQDIFNIMKIDVQGYELEVLKGGSNTLKRTKIVLLEMQNHDSYINAPSYYNIDSFLRDHNFTLFDIIPSIYDNKRLYEWDAIYVNNNL